MSVTVRPAESADVPWLLTELRAFDRFFGAARSLFPTDEQAETTLRWLIAEHVVFVASDVTGPVGFIAGTLGPHFFNPTLTYLSELFWWVTESARGSRAGALLLSAFLAYGKQHADCVVMTLEDASPVNPTSLLSRGFRLKETSYLLEVR